MMDSELKEIITWFASLVVLFSAVSFFVFIYTMGQGYASAQVDDVSLSLENSQLDRIAELDASSRNGVNPLVPVISSSLYELTDDYILYVHVILPDGTSRCYASNDVTITGLDSSSIEYVDDPCYSAAKDLLSYSDCRASVVVDYDHGNPYIVISNIREV